MPAFFFVEARRDLHIERRIKIAALVRFSDRWQSVTPQPEYAAGRRQLRYPQSDGTAAERRDADLAAEDRGRDRRRHSGVKGLAPPFELRVGKHSHLQIQIAGFAAVARAALGRGTNTRAVLDARGYPDVDGAVGAFTGDHHPACRAAEHLFQREIDRLFEIVAAGRAPRPRAAPSV